MRIIAGKFRGRNVDPVPGDGTRPTTDRVREAIASSIISNREGGFEGAHMLDAFAGSGAVGIEGLSRGAESVTFLDSDAKAIATIEANLAPLPLDGARAHVLRTDTLSDKRPVLPGGPFGIVFLDPPYAVEPRRVCTFVASLAQAGMLERDALIGYERAAGKGKKFKLRKGEVPQDVSDMLAVLGDGFELVGVKAYGNTQVVYFRYVD